MHKPRTAYTEKMTSPACPLPCDHLPAFIHRCEQHPVIGQVDPVNEQLIVDLTGYRQGRGGHVPAPGKAVTQCPSRGSAVNLVLGALAQQVVDERGEGSLLTQVGASVGICDRTVGAFPPLRAGGGPSVLTHRLRADVTFTGPRRFLPHSTSRPGISRRRRRLPPQLTRLTLIPLTFPRPGASKSDLKHHVPAGIPVLAGFG